jgi:DNA-binding MarR family transcriptional regulator
MSKLVPFNQAIRSWMDIFMNRSMRGWGRFAKSAGLSMPQFGLLMQMHHKGDCGMSEVSERFDITPAAASQLVDKLVQGGLVQRVEDPHDRRAKLLNLTDKGRELVQQGIQERYRWVDELGSKLSAEERGKVAEALTLLTEKAKEVDQ